MKIYKINIKKDPDVLNQLNIFKNTYKLNDYSNNYTTLKA